MDDQADAIAFLAAGAGLDLAGDKVARIDTHASSVFLIADRAFKLKRAVRYSYLDYSTARALREEACRAELEINRRIAPALYLGVRAIRARGLGRRGLRRRRRDPRLGRGDAPLRRRDAVRPAGDAGRTLPRR